MEINSRYQTKRSSITATIGQSNVADGLTDLLQKGSEWWYNNDTNWYLPFLRESGVVDDNGSELVFSDENDQYSVTAAGLNHKFTCQETGYYDINVLLKVVPAYFRSGGSVQWRGNGYLEYRWQLVLYKANGSSVILDSSINDGDPYDRDWETFSKTLIS